MDITNETDEPVIVEAERGGSGDPPDPPYRYRLMKNDMHLFANTGGVCRIPKRPAAGQGQKADFSAIRNPSNSQVMAVRVFQDKGGYAECELTQKGNLTYAHSYTLKKGPNGYEIS